MGCRCVCSAAVLLLFFGAAVASPVQGTIAGTRDAEGGLHLQVLHTNDMHSRFEQTSTLFGTCSDADAANNECIGGFGRVATVVRSARAGSVPTLYLDAGDTYQGSIWFIVHRWKIVARFLNLLNPDAMSLGNHEFDQGVTGLIPFIENATFPVLAANLNLTNEPELGATKLAKSTVIDINGTQVGIIGYLTPETKLLATTDNVIFDEEVAAITEEAARLKESGVNILIALGHSGFTMDKTIAAEVEDIDLVVGGHTNTFLFNGTQPDTEVPVGLYPTAITQSSGKIVYVVQAYAYTKYIGNFSVTFDSEGDLTHIEGNPILLDSSVEQAEDVVEELENWRAAINNLTITYVGSSSVFLDGDADVCRRQECNMGNLVTDAMIDYISRQYNGSDGWTDAPIAVMNSGSIRTSIPASTDSQISMADVLTVLPFGNQPIIVTMTGEVLISMLEWSVYYMTGDPNEDAKGAFLQVSGIQVTYDLSQPVYSKVVSVKVRCGNCNIPTYSDLNETETYSVITNDYMYSGGDGFSMLSDLDVKRADDTLADVVAEYLTLRSPVYPAIEWRITFSETDTTESSVESGASYVTYTITTIILPLLFKMCT
ncbi:protein 5NUC-like isoform X2 [Neodiprion fabricii]|uniref:protein 5NUC-like isoform X2 n=1 Tax=Neodiprion fabricii TaxID=2872261 RepID=UPI001ED8DE10|nr:protein 5NUC-like isoform X2 [Neodiprion fabricii]